MSAALDALYTETLNTALREKGIETNELNLELAEVALQIVVTRSERSRHVYQRHAEAVLRGDVGRALREAQDAKGRMDVRRDADAARANTRTIFGAVAARYGWYGRAA
jgi:hypothetical protein